MKNTYQTKILILISILILANFIGSIFLLNKTNKIELQSKAENSQILLENGDFLLRFKSDDNITESEIRKNLSIYETEGNQLIQDSVYEVEINRNEFQLNLNKVKDTNLLVKINKEVKDIYNRPLTQDIEVKVSLKQAIYYYIENSEFEIKKDSEGNIEKKYFGKDKIIKNDMSFDRKEVLIENERIKDFIVRNNFIIYITKIDENRENLFFYNIDTKIQTRLNLNDHRFVSLQPNPIQKNQFAVGIQQNKRIDGNYYGGEGYKLNIFNYDEKLTTWVSTIINPNNTADNVEHIKYGREGESILYRGRDSNYYVSSLSNIKENKAISVDFGKYFGTGGFSTKNKFLVFNDYLINDIAQVLKVINSNREEINIDLKFSKYKIDPMFFNHSFNLIATEFVKDFDQTKGIYLPVIYEYNNNIFTPTNLLDNLWGENLSVENPKISKDDRYVAFEVFNEKRLLDNYDDERTFSTVLKPEFAEINIFDTVEKKLLPISFSGVNLVWD